MDIDIHKGKENVKKFVCIITLLNKSETDIRNIVLDIDIPQEVELIEGEIQRQRGILGIEGGYTGLTIGNLAPDEVATVILKVKLKEEKTKEIECYGIIRKE